jgi:hypothetical protein
MNDQRLKKWIEASIGVSHIEPFMMPVLQGLGSLDCQLIQQDERFLRLPENQRATIQEATLLTERFTLSYLWVLGVYELVRTLDQKCHANKNLLDEPLRKRVNTLKQQIERLRIPLAKMAPAKRNPKDSSIAYPAISRDHGIAWQIAANVFISRREISDVILQLGCDIRELALKQASARRH